MLFFIQTISPQECVYVASCFKWIDKDYFIQGIRVSFSYSLFLSFLTKPSI